MNSYTKLWYIGWNVFGSNPVMHLFPYVLLLNDSTIYNRANFFVQQQLDSNGKLMRSYQLMDILRYSPSFQIVSSHTAQQIIRVVVDNWKSFFNKNKFVTYIKILVVPQTLILPNDPLLAECVIWLPAMMKVSKVYI